MTCLLWTFFLALFVMMTGTPAGAVPHGYVQDVEKERQERFYEIFLFAQPPPREKPLSEVIFNAELSNEFKLRYRQRFGQLDTESIMYQRTDYERLDSFRANPAAESKSAERRAFADYMIKRLFEFHVDNYVKSEPAMRPVYEAKEKLKKVEVRVNKQTKLEGRYSLAGNTLDVILENAYCDSKWIIEMDRGSFGPAPIRENTVVIGKSLTSRLRIDSTTQDREGRSRLEITKAHTAQLATMYGVSAAYKGGGASPRDSRIAWGFGYTF